MDFIVSFPKSSYVTSSHLLSYVAKQAESKYGANGKMKKQQLLANVLEKIDDRDLMNFG